MSTPGWLVLTWRLPAATSTPRVATWRNLRRLGAVILTPGAVIVPFSEHLQEQLGWIAEDIVQKGGDAYVLPVTELAEAEEEEIRRRMRHERRQEFGELRDAAQELGDRLARGTSTQPDRELATLQRRFANVVARDHFESADRARARRAIDLAKNAESRRRAR